MKRIIIFNLYIIMSNKSRKKLSYSFKSKSVPDLCGLSQIEESILREYKKVAYSIDTAQYSIDPILYTSIPDTFPTHILNHYSHTIVLESFTFYQMFSMLIFQYLFQRGNPQMEKIQDLKRVIYDESFLEGNYYTKGLLIKGFHQLQSPKTNTHQPIAHCLLQSDSIVAFNQCWKELLLKICLENHLPMMPEGEIDSSIFDLFACYFKVNFEIYWKDKPSKFTKEYFTFAPDQNDCPQQAPTLALIVNPNNQISVSQRSFRGTQSHISGKSHDIMSQKSSNSWNYIVLVSKIDFQVQDGFVTPEKQGKISDQNEISRISEVSCSYGETQEIKNLLDNKFLESTGLKHHRGAQIQVNLTSIFHTMEKANKLIENIRAYSQYLQKLQK